MTERLPSQGSTIELFLPFAGRWLAMNSPARRVPSHGTDLLGQRYAIDFVGVDDRRRSARHNDWRTVFASEPPERYVGYGRPILAPADGTVVGLHEGEVDHAGRRSQLTLVPYMLGQAARLREGVNAVAGNYLVLALPRRNAFVALVHLRNGSLQVGIGDEVVSGQQIAECGNSGNSTQPHVHLQVMDSADLSRARGVPMSFRNFLEWPRRSRDAVFHEAGLPGERTVVESA